MSIILQTNQSKRRILGLKGDQRGLAFVGSQSWLPVNPTHLHNCLIIPNVLDNVGEIPMTSLTRQTSSVSVQRIMNTDGSNYHNIICVQKTVVGYDLRVQKQNRFQYRSFWHHTRGILFIGGGGFYFDSKGSIVQLIVDPTDYGSL